jgi:hypothetical protein
MKEKKKVKQVAQPGLDAIYLGSKIGFPEV